MSKRGGGETKVAAKKATGKKAPAASKQSTQRSSPKPTAAKKSAKKPAPKASKANTGVPAKGVAVEKTPVKKPTLKKSATPAKKVAAAPASLAPSTPPKAKKATAKKGMFKKASSPKTATKRKKEQSETPVKSLPSPPSPSSATSSSSSSSSSSGEEEEEEEMEVKTAKRRRTARKSIAPRPIRSASSYKPLWEEPSTRQQGILLSFGSGDMSQLGLGPAEAMRERKYPTVLKSLNQVVGLSTGSLHNAALNSSGLVYTWGCNDDAALGRDGDEWLPNPVNMPPAVKVCCGSSHTLALTFGGLVYSWGTYRNGQGVMGVIGSGEEKKENKGEDDHKSSLPTLIESVTDVIDIACGDSISVALTTHGEVFQWGDIGNGQRISARLSSTRLTPHRVLFRPQDNVHPGKIQRVYAGGYSIFATDDQGVTWGWGPNNYNQIGLESDPDTLWVRLPRPLKSLASDSPVVDLAAALHHTICVNDKGQVYTFGRGSSGRLGHGDENDRKAPTLLAELSALPGDKVVKVACGEAHTCCVTEKGELYTFGNGDLNQLGNGDESDVLTPYRVQGQQLVIAKRQVLAAACGSQHTVILTTVGDASAIPKQSATASAAPELATAKSTPEPAQPAPESASTSSVTAEPQEMETKTTTIEIKVESVFTSSDPFAKVPESVLFSPEAIATIAASLVPSSSSSSADVPATIHVGPSIPSAVVDAAISLSHAAFPTEAAHPIVTVSVTDLATNVPAPAVDSSEPMEQDDDLPEPTAEDLDLLNSVPSQ